MLKRCVPLLLLLFACTIQINQPTVGITQTNTANIDSAINSNVCITATPLPTPTISSTPSSSPTSSSYISVTSGGYSEPNLPPTPTQTPTPTPTPLIDTSTPPPGGYNIEIVATFKNVESFDWTDLWWWELGKTTLRNGVQGGYVLSARIVGSGNEYSPLINWGVEGTLPSSASLTVPYLYGDWPCPAKIWLGKGIPAGSFVVKAEYRGSCSRRRIDVKNIGSEYYTRLVDID